MLGLDYGEGDAIPPVFVVCGCAMDATKGCKASSYVVAGSGATAHLCNPKHKWSSSDLTLFL